MKDTYIVIDDYNDEVKTCVGVYDNYCEALGKAYIKAYETLEIVDNGKVSEPRLDYTGFDYVYIAIEEGSNAHYVYIYYYGDKTKASDRWKGDY